MKAGFAPRGIIPAMVTPFDSQGNINESAIRKLANYLIEGGVHGLFPIGSQGEFYAMEREEKKRVLEIVMEEAHGKIPVYAGTGAITTRESMELTKLAENIGVDAVSILTPFFVSPSQEELHEHYLTIANNTNLPVILYGNPQRTGVNLGVDLVVRLSDVDNIVGIKDSSGDMTLIGEYIRKTKDDFSVLAGRDTMIYASLVYGGKGSITATANVAPKLVVEIYESYMQGDHKKALRAQYALAPLRMAFGLGTFPVVIKEALNMIGIETGSARAPIGRMQEENREKLRQVLRNLDLL
jgi:4-hydroxy-tetrahydrodipicolinate synthase